MRRGGAFQLNEPERCTYKNALQCTKRIVVAGEAVRIGQIKIMAG